MQTTELISERKTELKHKGKTVYEVVRKYCKGRMASQGSYHYRPMYCI
jgi:hypothetical protein